MGTGLKVVYASEVEKEPIRFLWYPYLFDHNVNLVGGEAGTGKTWFLCALMSAITSGQCEGMPGEVRKQGTVIYAGSEDGNAVIRSRLENVGADLSKIALIEDAFNVWDEAFLSTVQKVKPAVIILDPLLSYVSDKSDPNRYTSARNIMDSLRAFARRYDTAFVCVMHPPKKDDYRLIHRFTGSAGFVDAARSATYVGYHPDGGDKRVVIQPKNSACYTFPCSFRIDEKLGFIWEGEDRLLTQKEVEESHRTTGKDSVMNGYCLVIENVLRQHPEGLDLTAKEILDLYGKITEHDIKPLSFGQMLNKGAMQDRLLRGGILLKKGKKAQNRQRYIIEYTEVEDGREETDER